MATIAETRPRANPALAMAEAVRHGLTATPKSLPPWLFYDEAGSALFEEITRLPEYYLTRTERALLTRQATQIIATAAGGSRLRLMELGAGSAEKTRLILEALLKRQDTVLYQPVDVAATALDAACAGLREDLPGVVTLPIVANYTRDTLPVGPEREDGERQLLLWIGSSIGNFEPMTATEILTRIQEEMEPWDGLLLGVDLVPVSGGKSVAELVAAYDDATGVTAEFNRNILRRLNRELGANFIPEAFSHIALWNPQKSRVEMHLEAQGEQLVWLESLRLEVRFADRERLHTENCYKYQLADARTLMAAAGFPVAATWTDPQGWFAVLLGRKA